MCEGSRKARVQGEGLLVSKPGDPAFVVYLNTLNELASAGKKESLSETDRQQIIEAIEAYFSGRRMVVDFE
ncbi:Imm74 family immunity protein [Burkholderia glumae]|uniref:Imm74 family immunity protein n=1 Tax=Burkholderia glumae TaxID=337 RepID=A0ABY5BJG2_BURGL|nr:Imm74 family immunity protein [Burkholderia glumae]MCM2480658.1 Imm74 family immunity protein [Burkholderia glumae]MCM2509203.1 Imm74 family immunity protein [Burkholderia glumae]MCM2537668.1 Imm74 family immunity protein [Burkholderia glumae]MCM2550443.1 Imm74 family immunity protein [Burkholderia glumae]USS47192.1 Imm74 family immunity protein [Burkholderia glumae]